MLIATDSRPSPGLPKLRGRLNRHNDLPPATGVTGEEIHLFARPDVGCVPVVFVNGGCISVTRRVALDVMTYRLSPSDDETRPP